MTKKTTKADLEALLRSFVDMADEGGDLLCGGGEDLINEVREVLKINTKHEFASLRVVLADIDAPYSFDISNSDDYEVTVKIKGGSIGNSFVDEVTDFD